VSTSCALTMDAPSTSAACYNPTCFVAQSLGSSVSTCAPSEDGSYVAESIPDVCGTASFLSEDVARTQELRRRLDTNPEIISFVARNEARTAALRARLVAATVPRARDDFLRLDDARTADLRRRLSNSNAQPLIAENEAKSVALRARFAPRRQIEPSSVLSLDDSRTVEMRCRLANTEVEAVVAENTAKSAAVRARVALEHLATATQDGDDLQSLDALRTAELRYRMASKKLDFLLQEEWHP